MERRKKTWDVQAFLRRLAAAVYVDPVAKVVCLILAVILWMYVVGEAEVQFEFREVPVEFVDLSKDLAISEDSQRQLSLGVTGPKTAVSSLKSEDFRVLASLAGKREGEKWVVLSLENVASPRGDIKVVRIDPGSLRVFLERVESRVLPVTPKLQGEVPPGFQVKAKPRPEGAAVFGPASLFLRISDIPTEIIDIGGRQATFSTKVKLKKELRSIRTLDPDAVDVLVEIEETVLEKVISNVRIELQNPVPGRAVQIKPEAVTIKVRGPQNAVDRLDAAQLRVQVEFPADKQFHLAVPRAVALPERVEVISYEPPLVRVSVPGQ
ncbi:hypothetical protein HY522_06900 [bacterium]|nr:hypothetical protein [bacterium]